MQGRLGQSASLSSSLYLSLQEPPNVWLQPLSSRVIRHFLLRNAKEVFSAGAEQKRKGVQISHMPVE